MKKNLIIIFISASISAFLISLIWAMSLNIFPSFSEIEPSETNGIVFEVIDYEDSSYWKDSPAVYGGDAIPSEDAAIEVATSIIFNLYSGELDGKFKANRVTYIKEDDIWVVSFNAVSSNDQPLLGGGYYVVLQKSDGKVLKICRQ